MKNVINNFMKKIWRLLPAKFRGKVLRVRVALTDAPMIHNPTYADDGLISQHIVDFMEDSKFLQAYKLGKSTGALENHPGDIHFRAYVACWAAKHASRLSGDFVECGVGKALLSKTIVHYLDFGKLQKSFYLFDTFKGIPTQQGGEDEKINMAYLNEKHFAKPYFDSVAKSFEDFPNVVLVQGCIPDSLSTVQLNLISYISIDMNNAFAEVSAIKFLWSKLVFGGVVLLDDYAYGPEFVEQRIAWDAVAREIGFEILTLPTGQGLIIKNID